MNTLKEIVNLLQKELPSLRALHDKGWNPLFLFGETSTALKTCEAQVIYAIIKEKKFRDLLEIGTGSGFSTLYLTHSVLGMSQGKLDSIDFCAGPSRNARNLLTTLEISLECVNFITGNSLEIIPTLEKQYDFCLIDGSHDYGASKKDFLNIYPKVRKGGLIAFHDIQETLTATTPHQLWCDIMEGSLIELNDVSLVQLDSSIHELFKYPCDQLEITRLANKWSRASWIKEETSPMSMMGLLFKK